MQRLTLAREAREHQIHLVQSNPDLSLALGDRYRLDREIGAGGMANVYLAEDVRHHRQVAVKVLRPELASSLGAERFLREIEIAAGLQHPNILPLFDSGGAGEVLFYVMPFVNGESLRDLLARGGALPIGDAMHILREVADALAYAHKRGVIHRDIKPENILLADGHALVTDFGIAKAVSDASQSASLTATGLAMGTPAYMAPEQATADPGLDHRVDLYAFGVMAYEMLAGHAPFRGSSAQQIIAGHLTRMPEPIAALRSAVPPLLAQLVTQCLEKVPADRVQSAADIIRQLDAISANTAPAVAVSGATAKGADHSPPPASVSSQRRTRNRLLVGGALALMAVGVRGATLYGKQGRAGTLIGSDALAVNDMVLVAEFQNRTSDSTLAATVTDAVRTEVQQSRAVRVMSQQAMWAALARMQLAQGAALPDTMVRELAVREGAKAFIVGDVARLGSGYAITARVVTTAEGGDALTARATANNDGELIGAVEQVGRALRKGIGESLRAVAATAPLAQVATASLPALRAYTAAARAETEGERPQAIAMAKQAIALDSTFASAWSLLNVIYSNAGQVSDATDAVTRAFAMRDRLSEVARLEVSARYHGIRAEYVEEEAAWAALAGMGRSETNYANMLMERGRVAEAEVMARRALFAQPKSTIALWNLAEAQVAQRHFAAADSTAALARARIGESNYRYFIEVNTLAARRDFDAADAYLASPSGSQLPDRVLMQCVMHVQRGRLRQWRACRATQPALERQALLLLLAEFRFTADSASVLRGLQPFLLTEPDKRDMDSYAGAIALLADVGRVSDARRLLDEWRRRAGPVSPSYRADSALALGAVLAAEKQWDRAAAAFLAWNAAPAVSAYHWYNRGLPEAAEMLRRAGNADSAIALGERALATSSLAAGLLYESTWYTPLLEMLGDLHAAKGDKTKAAGYYRTYLQVLEDQDAPVSAQVSSVRDRLAKLTGEPGGR